jgi:tRNA(adenine34) deaminase
MARALLLAAKGLGRTRPNPAVGCVLVRDGLVIGEGWHQQAGSGHAEVEALQAAGDARGATAYVTLEPCAMCVGAIQHARIGKIIYGAPDPKTGACGGMVDLIGIKEINHHAEAMGGVLEKECSQILKDFFLSKRKKP